MVDFFFNDTATTEIYTLFLHDALPISYWGDVTEAVAEGPKRVVLRFKSNENRELPLILGQMQVLPKHWWEGRDFTRDRKSTRLNSSHANISYAVFCLKKKNCLGVH